LARENAPVIVVAATNADTSTIDPSILRPGRLDRIVRVERPDAAARRAILEKTCAHIPLAADVCVEDVAAMCHGWVGGQLVSLCQQAVLCALEVGDTSITRAHFDTAWTRQSKLPV
jgi:cell division protease FtsH